MWQIGLIQQDLFIVISYKSLIERVLISHSGQEILIDIWFGLWPFTLDSSYIFFLTFCFFFFFDFAFHGCLK